MLLLPRAAAFETPLARVTLFSVEPHHKVEIVAQYNPSQLQIEESANWTPSATSRDDLPPLEFSVISPRSLALELFFDGYEERPPRMGAVVAEQEDDRNVKTRFVEPLSQLLRVMDPHGREERRRPPVVKLAWGTGMPPFCGVLASLSTKLTMFLADGTPVRATCAIKMIEASRDSFDRRAANRVAPPRPAR